LTVIFQTPGRREQPVTRTSSVPPRGRERAVLADGLSAGQASVIPVALVCCAVFKVRREGAGRASAAGLSKLNSMQAPRTVRPRSRGSPVGRRACAHPDPVDVSGTATVAPAQNCADAPGRPLRSWSVSLERR